MGFTTKSAQLCVNSWSAVEKKGDNVSRRAGAQLDVTKTHLLALPHNHCLRPAMTCWLNENLYFKSRLCSNCHSAHFFVFCITRRHYKGSSQESWQLWMGKRSRTQKNANALQWHSTIYRYMYTDALQWHYMYIQKQMQMHFSDKYKYILKQMQMHCGDIQPV